MATTADLAPISLASTIIGFISFSLTLLIWLNAFWSAFLTIANAPEQVRDTLSTLRQGLYEEREYLKRLKRERLPGTSEKRGHEDAIYVEGGPVRVFDDAVRDLIRSFKHLEAPFLDIPPTRGREKELEWSYDATQHRYNCDLWHRIYWLRSKGDIDAISRQLSVIQQRRIAVEVAQCHVIADQTLTMLRDLDRRLSVAEDYR